MYSFIRDITKEQPFSICFVCLGNICRSPTAEGLFLHKVKEAGLEQYFYVDSAGTAAYHVGEGANAKSQYTANSHGVHLPSKARRFESADFEKFDLVLAMDASNLRNLEDIDRKGRFSDNIMLMREFDPNPDDGDVPDPYYGGMDGFEHVFQILDRSTQALVDLLAPQVKNKLFTD